MFSFRDCDSAGGLEAFALEQVSVDRMQTAASTRKSGFVDLDFSGGSNDQGCRAEHGD